MDLVAKLPNPPKKPAKNKSALLGKPVLLLPGFQTYVMYDTWRSVVLLSSSNREIARFRSLLFRSLTNLIHFRLKIKILNHKTVLVFRRARCIYHIFSTGILVVNQSKVLIVFSPDSEYMSQSGR